MCYTVGVLLASLVILAALVAGALVYIGTGPDPHRHKAPRLPGTPQTPYMPKDIGKRIVEIQEKLEQAGQTRQIEPDPDFDNLLNQITDGFDDRIPVCPECELNKVMEGDYLCSECRYG